MAEMDVAINAEASTSRSPPPQCKQPMSSGAVADKWVKPNGPPVGSTFGARLLTEDKDMWSHNAWDHATLPDDFERRAQEIKQLQIENPVSAERRDQYNATPAAYWNTFYSLHSHSFFKDRGWLRLEFPELVACTEADAGPKTVLEVGCGAGNTVFPLLFHNENPDLQLFATDYSKIAIDVVKANAIYPTAEHGKGRLQASVWDITSSPATANRPASELPGSAPCPITQKRMARLALKERHCETTEVDGADTSSAAEAEELVEERTWSLPEGIKPGTVDVITVIFVLSALHPSEWRQAIHNLYTALKPGGLLLIRDYGRHDLAQLRVKKDRLLDPNIPDLYIRGDGTRVYFFTKDELEGMLVEPPLEEETGPEHMFDILQMGEDRRLIVNRKERKQMYRIWMQVKARKSPLAEGEASLSSTQKKEKRLDVAEVAEPAEKAAE